ncbi:formylglycine-generating enzyme family protein, partial [Kingella kingae]|nr:formylglycine-generating enzyme family protein [Kingella kingae]
MNIRLIFLATTLSISSLHAADMVNIKGGSYRPLYLKKNTPLIPVKAFSLDTKAKNIDDFGHILSLKQL